MEPANISRIFRLGFGVIVFAAMAVLASLTWTQHQEVSRLRQEKQALEQKLKELESVRAASPSPSSDLQAEIDRLREDNKDLLRLRSEVRLLRERIGETEIAGGGTNEVRSSQASPVEIEKLRADNKDLLRLRNEVRQLREQAGEIEVLRAANARFLQAMQDGTLSNMVVSMTDVRKQGSLLGVEIVMGQPGQAYRGVVVGRIMPDPSGAQSDLKTGDIIIGMDGRSIESGAQLQVEMLTKKPGETIMLDVVRNGQTMRLPVQARAWPQ